nr:hypothetical protein Itr_chr12CG17960 [Ipomoea trifida]
MLAGTRGRGSLLRTENYLCRHHRSTSISYYFPLSSNDRDSRGGDEAWNGRSRLLGEATKTTVLLLVSSLEESRSCCSPPEEFLHAGDRPLEKGEEATGDHPCELLPASASSFEEEVTREMRE